MNIRKQSLMALISKCHKTPDQLEQQLKELVTKYEQNRQEDRNHTDVSEPPIRHPE